jgi:hypothetical protein
VYDVTEKRGRQMIDWFDWCLTPALALFQLYRGV